MMTPAYSSQPVLFYPVSTIDAVTHIRYVKAARVCILLAGDSQQAVASVFTSNVFYWLIATVSLHGCAVENISIICAVLAIPINI